jgi:hypothetical protein
MMLVQLHTYIVTNKVRYDHELFVLKNVEGCDNCLFEEIFIGKEV